MAGETTDARKRREENAGTTESCTIVVSADRPLEFLVVGDTVHIRPVRGCVCGFNDAECAKACDLPGSPYPCGCAHPSPIVWDVDAAPLGIQWVDSAEALPPARPKRWWWPW